LLEYNADSSFIPPLVYAIMGTSRDLAVGTIAFASLFTGSMLGKEVNILFQTPSHSQGKGEQK
jgi:MFS superfamily sulfate permease-like transporter